MSETGTISAAPTKRFFVRMLVRDIALEDAILDLLDNCIDGVVRSTGLNKERPYEGYHAHITMKPDRFEIVDNCGGIPKAALEKAFRMGRPNDENNTAATVGMYGIGMKRAVFKLGYDAKVSSSSPDVNFEVAISPRWLQDESAWELPIEYKETNHDNFGTKIAVTQLHKEVGNRFDTTNDNFIDYFRSILSLNYAFIMHKGFKVYVNDLEIKPQSFNLLASPEDVQDIGATEGSLKPYVFRSTIDGVSVSIYAGLSRAIPSDEELEKEEEARQSRSDAGWTVICNDRIVVARDTTRLTGWGEASVPAFHGQFMAFSGLVILRSDDPWKLPLTTTKRGIDASSELYLTIKDYMREATKLFTSFTNKWKKYSEDRRALYNKAVPLNVEDLHVTTSKYEMSKVRKLDDAEKFVPTLPMPRKEKNTVRISYVRPRSEYNKLALAMFETSDVKPQEMGEATFKHAYEQFLGRTE